MKFLGIALAEHDNNITFTDGKKVKYLSTEREYNIKHHSWKNQKSWLTILKKWDIDLDDIDAIAVTMDDVPFEEHQTHMAISNWIVDTKCPIFVVDHHYAHALSLWPLGSVPDVNYVFDGFGNSWRSHTCFHGKEIKNFFSMIDHGSFGQIMGDIGHDLNLNGHGEDHAGKVMGLSSYGFCDPKHVEKLKDIPLKEIRKIWDPKLWERKWNNFDINWLRTCHDVTAQKFADYILSCDSDTIGYSGGIAQNCVINKKLVLSDKNVLIPPHANDSGLSLGLVEFLRRHFHEEEFDSTGFPYWQDDEEPDSQPSEDTINRTAESLARGFCVGWYQGRGEIGPRALGNRSILYSARQPDGKNFLNEHIKHREMFRPYGASVLREDVNKYFDCDRSIPYMNVAVDVKDSGLKSITHIDNTSRIQTLDDDRPFSKLLRRYKELTGDSVILNTSLNIGGSPIASKMWHARELFDKTLNLHCMVIGDDILN